MTTYAQQTTSQVALPPASSYASWGSRVAAAIIDAFILLVVIFVFIEARIALHSEAVGILALLSIPAYYTIGHGSASGQTLGKRACSITVRRADDFGRLGYGGALWRFVIQGVLGVIPGLGLLNVMAPLWSDRKQAWHDRGARTVVLHF